MPVVLTVSTRSAIVSALPPRAVDDEATDDDLVRALVARCVDLSAPARDLTPINGAAVAHLAADVIQILHNALGGQQPPDGVSLDAPTRRLVEEAAALRRRAEDHERALADARAALVKSENDATERARAAISRAIHSAAQRGHVPDDLPPGPLRALAEEVAAVRAAADAARGDLETCEKERVKLERRNVELAKRAAEHKREAGQVERAVAPVQKKLEKAERRAATEEEGRKLAEGKAREMAREIDDARAVLDLARAAVGLPKSASVEDVIGLMSERFNTSKGRKTVDKRAPDHAPEPLPPPLPEPPMMRDADWRDLQEGELALDRARYRRLLHADTYGQPGDNDDLRRVLVLRVGDRVVWLRGDGLHEDGTTHADAPALQPRRLLRDALSTRALVIAEGVSGEPKEIASAWQEWLAAAKIAPGIPAALEESAKEEA